MTATTELDGRRVIGGVLTVPRVGTWQARLVVDTDEALSGAVTLTVGDGSLSLAGAVVDAEVTEGRLEALVVGGAGKLGVELAPRAYLDGGDALVARIVAADACSDAGEALDASVVLADRLPAWTRPRGSAGAALTALGDRLGVGWRVLPSGAVWMGPETWPASTATGELLRVFPSERRATYALDRVDLLAGTVLGRRRVERVEHHLGETFRSEVFW